MMKLVAFFLVVFLGSANLAQGDHTPRHPVIDTTRLIEVFYEAVDRGELAVYELKIDRSMIKPIEITYSYDLKGYQNTVLVVSDMTKRVICPYSKQFYIKSVTARLNNQGHIVEVMHDMIPIDDPSMTGKDQKGRD